MDENSSQTLPPPLLGCLYCHQEGTIVQSEGRKLFGMVGSSHPVLTCNHCGSVALLDYTEGSTDWRIRYRKYSKDDQYYYAALYLGKAGWLNADEALDVSRTAYVQRQRVEQARQHDLSWLHPEDISPPPPLIDQDEWVYLVFRHVNYRQGSSRLAHHESDSVLDAGTFYVTNMNIHLLGQQRNWSYPFTKIYAVDFDTKSWYVYVEADDTSGYFQGYPLPDEVDAQLAAAVLDAFRYL